jgi:hypothetical protein
VIRRASGVALGLAVFVGVTWLCEFSVRLAPSSPGAGANDRAYLQLLSPIALLLILVSWALGALAGGFVASITSRQRWSAFVVAAFGTMTGVATNSRYPPPFWFWVLTFAAFLPPAMFGARLALPEK